MSLLRNKNANRVAVFGSPVAMLEVICIAPTDTLKHYVTLVTTINHNSTPEQMEQCLLQAAKWLHERMLTDSSVTV
jgi:hypothetical protein